MSTVETIARQRSERREDLHAARRRRAYADMYSGELRELYRLRGHDPDTEQVSKLVERGLPPVGGGATGKGAAAFFVNLPPEGTFQMDVPYFNQETERNDVPQPVVPFTGLGGSRLDQRITNIGILTNVRLMFVGQLVVGGTGAVTANYPWPWNFAKRVTVQANGQTSLMQSEGLDLRARRQRLYRNPKEDVGTAPATDPLTGNPAPGVIANGTYPVVLMLDLPIVHDATTLTGALFAQSDANYLNWTIEPAMQGDLFTVATGGTVALTGSVYPTLTFFDIPYIDTQQGRQVAIPDLRWLHGFIASNLPFQNTGDVKAPFIKNAGQLIAYYLYLDNGGVAQLDPGVALDEFRLEYGGNRRPRVYGGPVGQGALGLLEENERNYNGRLRPGYLCLDLENENPDRDLIYPRGVSELNAITKITAGTVLNPNAHVHFVEETLFSGA
ncbi:MAG: hypothetical protein ACR2QA_09240 [Solirubrobacteraceae bacterium]